MCVEQYASSVDQGSAFIYNKLSEAGIINELIDDYEDMHGMSTYSLNEYIAKRLDETIKNGDQMKGHTSSKIILISQTIELIAKKHKHSIEEVRDRFYKSNVIEMLDDDGTELYGESALYLLSLYENYELKNKKNEK